MNKFFNTLICKIRVIEFVISLILITNYICFQVKKLSTKLIKP